jgi:2-keto-4-pentenoate hydratase/2-oxohepta-3-ene-1,7-dioic acid hydratase in catechol pathway
MVCPRISSDFDYEGELAVIICQATDKTGPLATLRTGPPR